MAEESSPKSEIAYETACGAMVHSSIEDFLNSSLAEEHTGKVDLLFTSPPFPLLRKKDYGNHSGEEYLEWLASLAEPLADLLSDSGSLVIEIGNAWEPGSPTMSTLPLRALLTLQEAAGLHLCQTFIAHNPARLPSPIQWVNVERIRVKDSYTHIWWLSRTPRPHADNRNVLVPYSDSMKQLLRRRRYNAGQRPSEHDIGKTSFLANNGGAIPPNVFTVSNTRSNDDYRKYCIDRGLKVHPARMAPELAQFFIEFLTSPGDLVCDPFAGSNTTGAKADELDRRWLSIERSREYILGSRARFEMDSLVLHASGTTPG